MRRYRRIVMLAAVLAGILAAPTAGVAATGVLARIEREEANGARAVRIVLNAPRRVVTFAPQTRGRLLEIRLTSPVPDVAARPSVGPRESLSWSADAAIPLSEVVYEPNALGGASLILRFSREVEYAVAAGADFRSVVVSFPSLPAAQVGTTTGADTVATASLMEQASRAMLDGDFPVAIGIYERVLAAPETEHTPAALELLGLAHERSDRREEAGAAYADYLRRYPQGEGAERVGQRLAALESATAATPGKLREPRAVASGAEWDVHGTVEQFYRMDSSVSGEEGTTFDDSVLFNDASVTARRRSSISEIRAHFDGGYVQDFEDNSESEVDVDELYVDGRDRGQRFVAAVGRQVRSSGGIFGRFDGGLVGYRVLDWLQVNAVGGLASDYSTDDDVNGDRYLYGLSFDVGPFFGALSGSVYGIEQNVDGIVDRRAVGGELRYVERRLSAFGLLDYDLYFDELNVASLLGTWTFAGGASLSAGYDERLIALLTTSNALQGQTDDSISDLRDTYSDGEIRDFARDRTARSRSATVGGALPISDSWQLTGDLTWLRMSGTDASGGIEATPGTGDEIFWTGQVIGNDLLFAGDIGAVAVRCSDTSEWESVGTSLTTRIPIGAQWRASPRFLFDYRMLDDGGDQVVVRPATRLEWTWRQSLDLELEVGGEWLSEEDDDGSDETPWGYFVSVGYRWSF